MVGRLSELALPVAVAALALAALAVLTAWVRLVPPLAGFGAFVLALVGGGGLGIVLGAIRLLRGAAEPSARAAAALAIAIGLGCLIVVVILAWGARRAPPIHDLTTNPADPPAFSAATEAPANRGRDLTYPEGAADTAAQQAEAYPDLRPIDLDLDAEQAWDAALATAEALGWRIVAQDPAARLFEAEAETSVFRFVDDVVVRVRAAGPGAVIDVRSTSRVGVSDLGVNADRIRRFRSAIVDDR